MKRSKQIFKLMAKLTSLADEIRNKLAQEKDSKPEKKDPKTVKADPEIMRLLEAYDNSGHKSMVHVRFDEQTARTLNHFKMATGTDVTKLVAFSVKRLFEQHPELLGVIKQFMQNL